MRDTTSGYIPTKKLVPWDDQPPLLVKSRNASWAVCRGASVHKTIITANSPVICRNATEPSTRGSLLAMTVVNIIANAHIAMVSSVPCQAWKT